MSRALRSHDQCARSLSARRLNSSFSAQRSPFALSSPSPPQGFKSAFKTREPSARAAKPLPLSFLLLHSLCSAEPLWRRELSSRSRRALVALSLCSLTRLEQIIGSITSGNNMTEQEPIKLPAPSIPRFHGAIMKRKLFS